jgi:hypothetical protein
LKLCARGASVIAPDRETIQNSIRAAAPLFGLNAPLLTEDSPSRDEIPEFAHNFDLRDLGAPRGTYAES